MKQPESVLLTYLHCPLHTSWHNRELGCNNYRPCNN